MRGRLELAAGARHRWGWRPGPLVRPFLERDVPCVVVGGAALAYYSDARTTPADLDLLVTPAASAAAYDALIEIVSKGVRAGPPEFSAETISGGGEMEFETPSGRLHLFGRAAGPDVEGIVLRRRFVWIDRTRIPICQLADLVALKQNGERDKDACDLEIMRRLGLTGES